MWAVGSDDKCAPERPHAPTAPPQARLCKQAYAPKLFIAFVHWLEHPLNVANR